MDKQISEAIKLLEKKKQLFDQYESLTDRLIKEKDINAIGKYITERELLANKIDEIDKLVHTEMLPLGEGGKAMLAGRIESASLPEELHPLCDLCHEVIETVRRIRLKNTEAISRCEQVRDDSMAQIKNASNIPKIGKYLSNLSEGREGNNFGSV